MNSSTAWIVQPPTRGGVDYSSASRYGKIQFFLNPEDGGSASPTIVLNKLRKALQNYKPGDPIGWAGGDPWNHFLTGVAFGESKHKEIPLLIWEKERSIDGSPNKNGFYIEMKLNRY